MNPLHIALAFAALIFAFGIAITLLNSARLNLKAALDREREAHRGAKLINTVLQKSLTAKNTEMLAMKDAYNKELNESEAVINEGRIQIKRLDDKIRHLMNNIESLELQLPMRPRDRQRNSKGQFLPRDTRKAEFKQGMEKVSAAFKNIQADIDRIANSSDESTESALNMGRTLAMGQPAKPKHRLTHGLTVKNPTEDEAKAIFAEAKRLGIVTDQQNGNRYCIWFSAEFGVLWGNDLWVDGEEFVTASEFIARMQGKEANA